MPESVNGVIRSGTGDEGLAGELGPLGELGESGDEGSRVEGNSNSRASEVSEEESVEGCTRPSMRSNQRGLDLAGSRSDSPVL